MKIVSSKLYFFSLPLKRDIRVGDSLTSSRDGLLVELTDDSGKSYRGEISPLAGLHAEGIEEAKSITCRLMRTWDNRNIDFARIDFLAPFFGLFETSELLPSSVLFGFESALLEAFDRQTSEVVATCKLDIAGLISLRDAEHWHELTEMVRALKAGSQPTIKIKIAPQNSLPAIRKLDRLCREKAVALKVRLDGNRSFSRDEWKEFERGLAELTALTIDFVEEPLKTSSGPADLAFPLALDEMLRESPQQDFTADVYILKPSCMQGISGSMRWARHGLQRARRIIFSSAYETGISMLTYARLMQLTRLPSEPIGLGGYECLASDVLTPRLPLPIVGKWHPLIPRDDLVLNYGVLDMVARFPC